MQIQNQELEAFIQKIALQKYTEQTTVSQKKIRVGHVTIALDRLDPIYTERVMKYFTSGSLEFIKSQILNYALSLKDKTLEEIETAVRDHAIEPLHFEDVVFSQFCLIEETTQEILPKVTEIGLPEGNVASVVLSMKGVSIIWSSKFPNLKNIDLSQMKITSVEGLSYCGLPVLESLNLQKNLITNISIFSKCKFPCLTFLKLQGNQIKEGQQLSRFNSPKITHFQIIVESDRPHRLRRFDFYRQNEKDVKTQLEVVNFIFKMESFFSLKQFKIMNPNQERSVRIRPTKTMLKKIQRIDQIFLFQNQRHREMREIRENFRQIEERRHQYPPEGRIRHLMDQIRDVIDIEDVNNNYQMQIW